MEHVSHKIVCLHWDGRFGNRMFTYAFGCSYARKYECIFYIPSEWEGDVLFKNNRYCCIITDDILRLHINQTFADGTYRATHLQHYKERTGDTLELVTFDDIYTIGKRNIAFQDLSLMYRTHCFQIYDITLIQDIFTFNDIIKASELYKQCYKIRGTYDVIHVRRGDISEPGYIGAHSCISLYSYTQIIHTLGLLEPRWVSDDITINTDKSTSYKHQWSYPRGEKEVPTIFFSFLRDFLTIIFGRVIVRGNSSFSWWAAQLSVGSTIYSPVIPPKPTCAKERYVLVDTTFVPGNYPHFMGHSSEGCYDHIVFQ